MSRNARLLIVLAAIMGTGLGVARAGQGKAAESKEFLYRLQAARPSMLTGTPTSEEDAAIHQHADYLKELTRTGVVILAGRTSNDDETTFGIVIFRAASEEAATKIMNRDPAVNAGVLRATLFPFHVFVMEGRPLP
jgi:uncharacterized protein YciI